MAIYLANVNGDWWEYNSEHPLYFLDTDLIPQAELDEIQEEHGGLENDKFEDIIMEFGGTISLKGLI